MRTILAVAHIVVFAGIFALAVWPAEVTEREQGIPSLIADDSIEASQSRPFPAVNKGEVRGVITIPSISSYGEPKEDTPFLKWMNAKTQAAIVREQNDKNW